MATGIRQIVSFAGGILHSPLLILASIGGGVWAGACHPEFSRSFSPVGDLFLSALKMCSLPIIVCAVVSSVGKLFSRKDTQKYLAFLLLVFFSGLMLTSAIVVVAGVVFAPGRGLSTETMQALGRMITSVELSGGVPEGGAPTVSLADFFVAMMPDNIFSSLSTGENLRVLVFSLFFGVALGLNKEKKASGNVVMGIDAAFEALLRLISWVMYAMPFGVFSLMAAQVANAGVSTLFSMGKLIAVFYGVCTALLVFGFVLMCVKSGRGPLPVLRALREGLFIALATRSSYAAIPSVLKGLHHGMKLEKTVGELVVPLSLSLNPLGNVVYYGMGAMFIAQLSGLEMHGSHYVILILGAVFAALAGSSLPGSAAIGIFSILMDPLGLSMGATAILLLAVDPILDPMCTVLNVNCSCVASVFVADKPAGSDEVAVEEEAPL